MNPALWRQGTSDAAIWKNVVDLNEYRLPEKFSSNDLILDIGLNTGAFAHACIQRGAGKVIGFEPDPDNYAIARKQLKSEIFNGLCEVYPLAVVGGSGFSWRTFSGVVQKDGEINHGGAFLFSEEGSDYGLGEYIVNRPFKVPCIAFQHIEKLIPNGFRKALIKADCESGEFEIFCESSCQLWEDFDSIVGEYHPSGTNTAPYLKESIERAGMKVELIPHQNSELGLFFARQ